MENLKQEKPEGLSRRLVKEIRARGFVSFEDVIILARQNGRYYREETITRKLRADSNLSEALQSDLACIESVMKEDGSCLVGYRWICGSCESAGNQPLNLIPSQELKEAASAK